MAGVYIKGMEMPGSCGECRFLNPGNYKGKEYPCVCDVGDFLVKPSETDLRDGLCPLVELPDHGDLIDREELIKKMLNTPIKAVDGVDFDQAWFTRVADTACQFVDEVERQVAVIPADKEE